MHVLMLTPSSRVAKRAKRPWVAKITGMDKVFGLKREFLASFQDHSEEDVQYIFHLDRGEMYEVFDGDRYFCRIKPDWSIERLPLSEVLAGIRLFDLEAREQVKTTNRD
jgi:hypothetical protein